MHRKSERRDGGRTVPNSMDSGPGGYQTSECVARVSFGNLNARTDAHGPEYFVRAREVEPKAGVIEPRRSPGSDTQSIAAIGGAST